ncbi:hypothetical protein H8L47_07300 [Undibacterium sp. NL8W]|uniref:Uncharacterized protein n=2 Tax=Undibacterium umbellatum TaxID=2762300 RepID=A0ABR6Z6G8_9BURK|nr:hypothetical protein [Undibacterium umbellatum]
MKGAMTEAPAITARSVEQVLWDVTTESPELHMALSAILPDLDTRLAALRLNLPCAHGINPFQSGEYQRPYRHLRAFYQDAGAGVLAHKGTEVYAHDRDQHLAVLSQFRIDYPVRGKSLFSAAEHFALVEQKIPLAISAFEAVEDAKAACMLQQAHLKRFGNLACIPTPLLVLAWPLSTRDSHLAALRSLLSERAMRIVETSSADGLAAIIYHYPSLPLRVAHLPVELKKLGNAPWLQRLASLTAGYGLTPEQVVNRWIDLVARMLALGFLPGRTEHIGIGHCLEMQNAVIDGGFVDLGSIIPMAEVKTDAAFMEMLMAAFADLSKTVRHFMLGPVADVEAEYRNPSLLMLACLQRVVPALLQRLRTYPELEPRLQDYLDRDEASCFTALAEEFKHLSPAMLNPAEHA